MPQRFAHGSGSGSFHRPMVEGLESRQLLSTTWFVSPGGSNSNPGTLGSPFQTIQQAANKAQPGDDVEIMAGVYHEQVTPKSSGTSSAPITYQAYDGQSVTITGADPITDWTHYSGAIYSAPMSWDLGEGNNEVFVNGSAINEAMWPNSGIGNFSHPSTATMQSTKVRGGSVVIYNSALTQPANTWAGAIIHMNPGQSWEDQTGTVVSSAPGSITVRFANLGKDRQPTKGNQFYLFGKFQALDTAGEWYRDPTSGLLYAWMPNSANPSTEDVEVKHRLYAFDLRHVHNITVEGVNLFACTIMTGYGSSGVVVNHISAMYPSQQLQVVAAAWVPPGQGIDILGANSIVENSMIAFSSGDGIDCTGAGSLIENNVIHDVAYTGTNSAGIRCFHGSNITVEHNTIYNSGRHGIMVEAIHAVIEYNTIHDVGLQTTEAGGIYTANTNAEGSVMAYNTVYNIHTSGYGGTAFFADNYSTNWIIHNNVSYNVDYGFKMNNTCNGDQVYNNTLGATRMSINTNDLGNWDGVKIYNNIFEARILTTPGAKLYNNAFSVGSANSSQGAGGGFGTGAGGGVGA